MDKQNTQSQVYNTMRKSILSLNLLPGTAISENEISQKFHVSRTPVRETFIKLEKECLIQIIPQKGTFVSLIDLDRVEQEYFLRRSLECSVIEQFIKKADDSNFAEMQKYIKLQKSFMEQKDYLHFIEYDDLFHKSIFEGAGQKLSWDLTENFSGHYFRVRMLSIWQHGIADNIVTQHKELLDALKQHDLNMSKERLESHLLKLNDEKEMLLTRFPDYFNTAKSKDNFAIDFGGLNLS